MTYSRVINGVVVYGVVCEPSKRKSHAKIKWRLDGWREMRQFRKGVTSKYMAKVRGL